MFVGIIEGRTRRGNDDDDCDGGSREDRREEIGTNSIAPSKEVLMWPLDEWCDRFRDEDDDDACDDCKFGL